jgi:hypothetical protein
VSRRGSARASIHEESEQSEQRSEFLTRMTVARLLRTWIASRFRAGWTASGHPTRFEGRIRGDLAAYFSQEVRKCSQPALLNFY